MSCVRVLSNFSWLILVLGLSLRLVTPAHAQLEQGTETTRVLQNDKHGGVSWSSAGQLQPSPVEATPAANEPTLRAERPMPAESRLSDFVTKLAFDLGLIRQRQEDAWAALTRAGITPVGGWQRSAEPSPEVFYEVLAAARRAASAGRLSVSADGAEAIVRAALTPFLVQLEEVPAAQPSVVAPEDRAAMVSQESVLLYEYPPTWYTGWQNGFLAAPGGVIIYHPRGFQGRHGHHKFLPRKSWRGHHRRASFGFPAGRSSVFAGPGHRPALRVGSAPSRIRVPSVSRMPRGLGTRQLSMGRRAGGFSRR
jgi:hypothetical protein